MVDTMNHQKEVEEYISLKKLTNNEERKSRIQLLTILKRYCALFQPIGERTNFTESIDESEDEIGLNILSKLIFLFF